MYRLDVVVVVVVAVNVVLDLLPSLSLSLSVLRSDTFKKNRLGVKTRFFLCNVPIL
jgi:hypothetical protein